MQTQINKNIVGVNSDVLLWTKEYDDNGSRYLSIGKLTKVPEGGITYDKETWFKYCDRGIYIVPSVDSDYSIDDLNDHIEHARIGVWNSIGRCIVNYLEVVFGFLVSIKEMRNAVEDILNNGNELSTGDITTIVNKLRPCVQSIINRPKLVAHVHTLISNYRVYGSKKVWTDIFRLLVVMVYAVIGSKYYENHKYLPQCFCSKELYEFSNVSVTKYGNKSTSVIDIKEKLLREGIEANPGPKKGADMSNKPDELAGLSPDIINQLQHPQLDWYVTPLRSGSRLYSTKVRPIRNTVFKTHFYIPHRFDVPASMVGARKINSRSTILTVEWNKPKTTDDLTISVRDKVFSFPNMGKVRVSVSIGVASIVSIRPSPSYIDLEFKNYVSNGVQKQPRITYTSKAVREKGEQDFVNAFNNITFDKKDVGNNSKVVGPKRGVKAKFVKNRQKASKLQKEKSVPRLKKILTEDQIAKRKEKNAKRKAKRLARVASLVPDNGSIVVGSGAKDID